MVQASASVYVPTRPTMLTGRMTRASLCAIGIAMLMFAGACSQTTPGAPTSAAPEVSAVVSGEASEATSGARMGTMAVSPTVTLQPDLTANPSWVTVAAGTRVKFVNNSGRFITIHSYNCYQFQGLDL